MTTEVEQSKLNIHVLNQNQYEGLSSVSDTELYIVDPQFQGGKFLASDANGDIVEKDALQGVQINGTDLTPDANNKVNIPKATNTALGVVMGSNSGGTQIGTDGSVRIYAATNAHIDAKTSVYLPIVPATLDYAVKEGLGNYDTVNKGVWTDAYKEHACETIGATQTEIVDWIDS